MCRNWFGAHFLLSNDVTRQLVNLQPAGPIEVRNERLFNFVKADESSTLSLSTSTLVVESRRHDERAHFASDAKVGIDALMKTCGPVVPTRLGLRYVNVVNKEQVAKDLGRPTTWPRLIPDCSWRSPRG